MSIEYEYVFDTNLLISFEKFSMYSKYRRIIMVGNRYSTRIPFGKIKNRCHFGVDVFNEKHSKIYITVGLV